jgi:hypothetical protein
MIQTAHLEIWACAAWTVLHRDKAWRARLRQLPVIRHGLRGAAQDEVALHTTSSQGCGKVAPDVMVVGPCALHLPTTHEDYARTKIIGRLWSLGRPATASGGQGSATQLA